MKYHIKKQYTATEPEKKYHLAQVIARILPIQIRSAPWNCLLENCLGVMHGLAFAASVAVTQRLFDTISDGAAGKATYGECVTQLVILAAVTLGQQIINGIQNFHGIGVLLPKSAGGLTERIHQKVRRIDPVRFEDTAFLDDLNKAKQGISAITLFCMLIFVCVSFYGVYFIAVGMYLFRQKPMLLLTLLLAFLPAMLAQTVNVRIFANLEEDSAPLRRTCDYYRQTICDRAYFKETRILGAFDFFYHRFEETLKLLSGKTWKAEQKSALLQLFLNFTTFAGMGLSAYMLFTATMRGEITVGMFAAVFAALNQIFAMMQEVIVKQVGNMNRDLGKVVNFIRLLDMPERDGEDGETDFTKGIVAENVSFCYPGRDMPSVKNISLHIAAGEMIAIVGENGAGKTTLVRLLTGIYRPTQGRVLVGGLDTARYSFSSVRKRISGVFQKYQRYKMTLKENVIISDYTGDVDTDKVSFALKEAGFEEKGVALEDMLSPEYGGIDLSGGQWQRIAIARGLYRVNDLIVLDEPTSAIDPIEEAYVYRQFARLAKGKCALVVTHRIGSARLADRILVMDAGRIVDMGTHEELIARPGRYAKMWEAQAQWYERG